jgi:hypothetical protein
MNEPSQFFTQELWHNCHPQGIAAREMFPTLPPVILAVIKYHKATNKQYWSMEIYHYGDDDSERLIFKTAESALVRGCMICGKEFENPLYHYISPWPATS